MTVQSRLGTIQTGRWDSIKGDHNRLIQVNVLQRWSTNFGTLTTDRLIQVRLYSSSHKRGTKERNLVLPRGIETPDL